MPADNNLVSQLCSGLNILGEQPAQHPVTDYISFIELLDKWNRTYNLTAIRQPERMVAYHVLDSIAVLPYVQGKSCLDVGSGAGIPGLILAMARPETSWVLVDSNNKKIRFINQAIMDLGISNAVTEHCRIENYQSNDSFSTIISRACGKAATLYHATSHLLRASGRLLMMKGPDIAGELETLKELPIRSHVHLLEIPGIKSQRNLLEISLLPSAN